MALRAQKLSGAFEKRALVHTTPEEFENGGFTLRTLKMFSVLTSLEEFDKATITAHFGFVFEEK